MVFCTENAVKPWSFQGLRPPGPPPGPQPWSLRTSIVDFWTSTSFPPLLKTNLRPWFVELPGDQGWERESMYDYILFVHVVFKYVDMCEEEWISERKWLSI